ncbi:hypothetical protein NNC19_18175 [Clostridium sp. SHJSY1]|uniref:cohesin domain-containing protein n=1 Tax=Clostridium sp. SHJSY1 TaxID=2942483 RepID=UPI002875995A|nr:hypothetical protein [Clostridium sp. SHJSY1]MDS0527621.1 hypothetical protein [Clostridium sp. SHJSY1]
MNKKKHLLTLLGTILMFLSFVTSNIAFAADGATTPTLNITPNNEGNYVSLNWTKPDSTQNYSYMIYSKKSTDSLFQSIPAKNNVKVLNVYPGKGNNLKTWMETNGYGKGLISVDEVDIDTFNSSPDSYLKDVTGNWKYDVIYEGAWDSNNNKDFSENAEKTIEQFIKSGRGYLAGHDTLYSSGSTQSKLSSYANIITGVSTVYGNTSITINKKGLLTNYPWNIGDVGKNLTVPASHTNQYAQGDIWIKYNGNSLNNNTEITSYNGQAATNNFYLTTWNNTAMIQTGHSNGEATEDEQKILANTLFYLAQVTDTTSWDDHKGQDLDAPTKPNITKVSTDVVGNKTNITFDPSTDNGTTYDYYVEAKNATTSATTKSDIKTGTITTGLKGYSVVVDQKPDTIPSNTITTTSNNFTVDQSYSSDFYVHVAAIDNAGNMSEISHYKYSYPTLTLTQNQTSDPSDPVTITATATSSTSEIEKIQTPDGNWINASTTDYIVNDNGTYSFTAIDKDGHKTTQSITISSIIPKIVLNVEPEKDKIHLNENVSALLIMDNIKEIAAEDVRIKYDSTKLQFLGCNELDGIKLAKNDVQNGELRFILVSKGLPNVVNSKKALLKLNFKGIAPGDALVDVTKGRVSDGIAMEKNLKDAECGQAVINISDKELIDVNNDGDFSLLDLAIDGRHYGEDPSTLPQYNTDVVINGAIDDNDFSEIVKLMLKNPNYNF